MGLACYYWEPLVCKEAGVVRVGVSTVISYFYLCILVTVPSESYSAPVVNSYSI